MSLCHELVVREMSSSGDVWLMPGFDVRKSRYAPTKDLHVASTVNKTSLHGKLLSVIISYLLPYAGSEA